MKRKKEEAICIHINLCATWFDRESKAQHKAEVEREGARAKWVLFLLYMPCSCTFPHKYLYIYLCIHRSLSFAPLMSKYLWILVGFFLFHLSGRFVHAQRCCILVTIFHFQSHCCSPLPLPALRFVLCFAFISEQLSGIHIKFKR